MDANREAETGQTRLRLGSDCRITTISGQQPVRRVSAPRPASLALLTRPAPNSSGAGVRLCHASRSLALLAQERWAFRGVG